MPDEMVIRHCAPTLASLKTGSLFSCPCESEAQVFSGVRELNRRLGGKGVQGACAPMASAFLASARRRLRFSLIMSCGVKFI